MDRDALVAFAKRKLRIGTSGEALLTDSVLADYVNEALRKFSRERPWPWLLTSATVSVATTGVGSLPADYTQAFQLTYDGNPVPYVGFSELLASANRFVWSENGTQVQVEPAPSASTNFTLHYYQREDDLSSGSTSPIAPTLYHDPIGLWAAHLGAMARRDYELADTLAREYDREIDAIAAVIFRKKGGGVRVTRRSDMRTVLPHWT